MKKKVTVAATPMPRLQRHQSFVVSKLTSQLNRVQAMQAKLIGGDQTDEIAAIGTAVNKMDQVEHLLRQIDRCLTNIETVV